MGLTWLGLAGRIMFFQRGLSSVVLQIMSHNFWCHLESSSVLMHWKTCLLCYCGGFTGNHCLSPPPAPAPMIHYSFCSETKVTSTSEVVSLCWDDELIGNAEVPSFIEQRVIPFVDQTNYLLKMKQPLNAGQALGAVDDHLIAILKEQNLQHKWNQTEQVCLGSCKKVWAYM